MFHRVKSEPQKNEQGSQLQNAVSDDAQPEESPKETHEVVETQTAPEAPVEESREDSVEAEAAESAEATENTESTENTHTEDTQEETNSMSDNTEQQDNTQETQAPAQASYQPAPRMPQQSYATQPNFQRGGYNSTVPEQEEEIVEDGENRSLTISRGITMSGEIEACDHLVVEGTVEAALKGARVLDIAESGTFYGTVDIEEATVAGRFEGDLTVAGRLTVRAGGIITGSFAYGELEVEAGAIIDGRLTPISALQQQGKKPSSEQGKTVVARKNASTAKKENPAPANSEGGLFSSKTA